MSEWRAVAQRQQGCITAAQLRSCGVSPNLTSNKVARGELIRRGHGIYVVHDIFATSLWDQEAWLALLRVGPQAALSHRSAARVWRLDGVLSGDGCLGDDVGRFGGDGGLGEGSDRTAPLEVTAPRSHHRNGPGVRRRADLDPTDVIVHRGVRVTTAARTLLDLGSVVGIDILERAVECALRRNLVSIEPLEHRVAIARGRGRAGPAALGKVLLRRPTGAPPTDSDAETLFVQLVRDAGLPDPIRQLVLRISGGILRLDFAWPEIALAIEIDGAATHASSAALDRDLRRQNRLALGWTIVRFTWHHVALEPTYVVATVRRHYALLCGGPVPSEFEL